MNHYFNFTFYGLLTCFLIQDISYSQDTSRYQFQSRHMGTEMSIVLYAENKVVAMEASDSAFKRIEKLNQILSDYVEESELNHLSGLSGSGEWLEISKPFFEILKESIQISENTDGLFDVTIGPMTHNWRYIRRLPEPQLPDAEKINRLQQRVGHQYVELDDESGRARLTADDMQLDLGGIAKGYAAKEALRVLYNHGIHSALVNAGGDIAAGAPPPGRTHWEVAVPKGQVDSRAEYVTFQLTGKSLTTSGDMFQFIEIDGVRYSHILSPETGIGATDQLQVTVISSNSMWADAYASALSLMEPEDGIRLIESLDETEAIINRESDGEIHEWVSSGIRKYLHRKQPN